jgi:hypothetical protein
LAFGSRLKKTLSLNLPLMREREGMKDKWVMQDVRDSGITRF